MEIDSARATLFPNHHLHSRGPMSSFVVYYLSLTRRCLSKYQTKAGIASLPCAAALCRQQRLHGARSTCQDHQRRPLRLDSAVAGDGLSRRLAPLWLSCYARGNTRFCIKRTVLVIDDMTELVVKQKRPSLP